MKWEDKATSKGGFDLAHPGRREAAACPSTTPALSQKLRPDAWGALAAASGEMRRSKKGKEWAEALSARKGSRL